MRRPRSFVGSIVSGLSVLVVLGVAGQLAWVPVGRAETAAGDAEVAAPSAVALAEVEAARSALEGEIAELNAREGEGAAALLETLRRLDRYLVQRVDALRRASELDAELPVARAELAAPLEADIDGEPPFDLARYDTAAEAADREALLSERLDRASRDAIEALAAARQELEEAERERRRAKEAVEQADGDPEVLRADLGLRRATSRVAEAAVALREQELENAKKTAEIHRKRAARLAAVRDWVLERVAVDDDQRTAEAARLDEQASGVRRRIERVRAAVAASRDRVAQAAHQRELSVLAERLERIDDLRTAVERRFALFAGEADRTTLTAWVVDTRETLQALDREESLKSAEMADLERQREKLATDGPAHTDRRKVLEAVLDLYREDLDHLGAARGRQRRLLVDLERRVQVWTVGERLEAFRERAAAVWRYEITASEDRPITVGKVVLAILVFGVGYLVARLLARQLGRRALPRLGFDAGAAHAFEVLGFYALVVVAFLVALRMVNIPLTAFAVAGGAIAIGVGFGSQNVMSNFISGLILLAERPIKIGDLVDVEGTYGNVERIGLRSTIVRTGQNVHVIVPNAAFLENRVINWTHNDPQVRISLAVGIVYGAPTREAKRLLEQALAEHPRVLPHPAPIILFTEFGDNSLNFEAHFWVQVRTYMDRRVVESELRFTIDDLFREAGIVIAFPQRDVHLDTTAPLEVRLVDDET